MERKKEMITMMFAGLFGIVLIIIIPYQIEQVSSSMVGPQFIPYLAAGVIILSSLSSIVNNLVKKPNYEKNEEGEGQANYLSVALVFTCIILWILLVPIIGYIIATLLATAFTCFVFKDRKIIRITLVSVLFSLGSYYIFTEILQVNLPAGIFF